MLQLFRSIFRREPLEPGQYPPQLIDRAIERAVDGTDPRLRIIRGYPRRLRPAVIRAIDYAVTLVGSMPDPVELTRQSYATDARLPAIFSSVSHMREVLAQDPALSEFLQQPRSIALQRVYALMMVEKQEKNVFGMELLGEVLQREVAQTSLSFFNHRLLDPATDQDALGFLLRRRAFDGLLALALGQITQTEELRTGLKRQRDLLRHKLKLLGLGHWGFEAGRPTAANDAAALEAELGGVEERLQTLRPDTEMLEAHLDIVVGVLSTPDNHMQGRRVTFAIDRMGIKHERPTGADLLFELSELRTADGSVRYLLPVIVLRSELPPPVDFSFEGPGSIR